MKKILKDILRPITPKILKRLYRSISINIDDYYLLPKKEMTYAVDQLFTSHNADFQNTPLFKECYAIAKRVDNDHLLNKNEIQWRMHVAYWAGNHVKSLEGDFIDCGVNTGFVARSLMHYIGFDKLNKKYYLLDTFSGLDPRYSSEKEMQTNILLRYNEQKDNYEKVKKTFEDFNVSIIKGSVPDTLPQVQAEKICFLHLDMNAAIPEVKALDYFWSKIVKGGVVLLDDYGFKNHKAQKEAHDNWALKNNVEILSLPTGQGLIMK